MDWERFTLLFGHGGVPLRISVGRFVRPGKLAHQCVPTVVVEIHTGHIGVVQRTGSTSALVTVAAPGTIKVSSGAAGMSTATTGARKRRTLKRGLVLTLEALQQVGGRLGSELVIAKADADRTSCKVKTIHLFKGLTSLVWITEPRTVRGVSPTRWHDLLNEPIASASASFFLLQLHKLEFTKGFKDVL